MAKSRPSTFPLIKDKKAAAALASVGIEVVSKIDPKSEGGDGKRWNTVTFAGEDNLQLFYDDPKIAIEVARAIHRTILDQAERLAGNAAHHAPPWAPRQLQQLRQLRRLLSTDAPRFTAAARALVKQLIQDLDGGNASTKATPSTKRSTKRPPRCPPPSPRAKTAAQEGRSHDDEEEATAQEEAHRVPDDSRWTVVALVGKALVPTHEVIVPTRICVFQQETDPDEDEAEVRAWCEHLFAEEDPWAFIGNGVGTPRSIMLYFPVTEFSGMPEFFTIDKAPVTRVGSLWRLARPDGIVLGQFTVTRIARVTGRDLNALDRTFEGRNPNPAAHYMAAGEPRDNWCFGQQYMIFSDEGSVPA